LTVVGVVGDARYRELQATRLDLYMSYLQGDHRTNQLMVPTRMEPTAVAAAVRETVWGFDKEKAPPALITMTSAVSEALAMPRFATRVFGAFALVALLLAALGLYGLLAYSVTSRTREIGLRVALGALPRDLGSLVLREGLGLTLTGITLGLVIARAATRLLESLLYGVKATDGVTFAAVAALLLAVAALACGLAPSPCPWRGSRGRAAPRVAPHPGPGRLRPEAELRVDRAIAKKWTTARGLADAMSQALAMVDRTLPAIEHGRSAGFRDDSPPA
jgi:putative ABC transport system permease protein